MLVNSLLITQYILYYVHLGFHARIHSNPAMESFQSSKPVCRLHKKEGGKPLALPLQAKLDGKCSP